MSTFKGIIAEFPQIRVDYFRQQPGYKAPLACFLSHVHSDHLAGLESLRAPFVYCSAGTREILIRLEKHHYRINFAKTILESRNVTYETNMHKLAKPLPLDTPTVIELAPGNTIRVTLIDANHCVGAVMFLIEGDGKAVLYTGDIRAETWWVNSLVQNPVLLPYKLGLKQLECIYLDTTFATKEGLYREFPSKAQGIKELLEEVSKFPKDTIFYFHSWTFGYESVWIALSAFLGEKIHVDDYRARIYGSLSTLDKKSLQEAGLDMQTDNKFLRESGLEVREASALCGFRNGNHIQPGCLTSQENVRIHSCERGMGCKIIDQDPDAKVVHIIPIVTRAHGVEMAEFYAGGGEGDLDQKEALQTSGIDIAEMDKLTELCAKTISNKDSLSKVLALLQRTLSTSDGKINLETQLLKASQESQNDSSLHTLVSVLSSHTSNRQSADKPQNRTIRFPYSRHSSYRELCDFITAFQPRDVFPCTVDEKTWTPEHSMQALFGEHCSRGCVFRHDLEMMAVYEARQGEERMGRREKRHGSMSLLDVGVRDGVVDVGSRECKRMRWGSERGEGNLQGRLHEMYSMDTETLPSLAVLPDADTKTKLPVFQPPAHLPSPHRPLSSTTATATATAKAKPAPTAPSSSPVLPKEENRRRKKTNSQLAFEAATGTYLTWAEYGGLESTRRKEDREEIEL